MIKNLLIIFFFVLLCFFSCKKKREVLYEPPPQSITTDFQNGLPSNPDKIDAYLFARYYYTLPYSFVDIRASFADSRQPLITNLNFRSAQFPYNICQSSFPNTKVNSIAFVPYTLGLDTFYGCTSYVGQYQVHDTLFIPPVAHWTLNSGNNFKSFDLTVPRGFPQFHFTTGINTVISKTSGVTFTISNQISNYDSLYLIIQQPSKSVVKRFGADSVIHLDTMGLSVFAASTTTPNASIEFVPFNFSHRIIWDKKYVFELTDVLFWGGFRISP